MIQRVDAPHGFTSSDSRRSSHMLFSRLGLSGGIFALSVWATAWVLHKHPTVAPGVSEAPQGAPASAVASTTFGRLLVGLGPRPRAAPVADEQAAASEPVSGSVAPAQTAALAEHEKPEPAPIAAAPEAGPAVPLPPRRPAELALSANRIPLQAPVRRLAQQDRAGAVPAGPADNRTFLEKFFDGAQQPSAAPPSGPALAYAAPETGALGGALGGVLSGANLGGATRNAAAGSGTAVYDISAHTVYMPDGTKLEAHSGLGSRLDDPRYVHERMRGPTPPHVYTLSPREALFHGVEALRLTPVGGGGSIYGRAGLLAHTFMLGPNGDSNGCVSFRNYGAFLQAYKRGEIRRLVVVAHQ